MVVLVLGQIEKTVFFGWVLGGLEGLERILDRTGGDAVPGGYITKFHSLEVNSNIRVAEIPSF